MAHGPWAFFLKMTIADGEFVGKVYLEKSLGIYLNNIQYQFFVNGFAFRLNEII